MTESPDVSIVEDIAEDIPEYESDFDEDDDQVLPQNVNQPESTFLTDMPDEETGDFENGKYWALSSLFYVIYQLGDISEATVDESINSDTELTKVSAIA